MGTLATEVALAPGNWTGSWVAAHSGRNFLAFNRSAQMANGGTARDPETIRFDTPPAQVTFYAPGGFQSGYFEMDAFDGTGTLVAVNTVTTRDWSPLRVVYTGGIDHVVLTASNLPQGFWVYDDLSFGDVSGVDSGDAAALASAANSPGCPRRGGGWRAGDQRAGAGRGGNPPIRIPRRAEPGRCGCLFQQ